MAKVDIGELEKLIEKQPEVAANLALANRILLTPNGSLGDYVSFIVLGTEETSPEILIRKEELRRFALEVIAVTTKVDGR